MEYLKSKLAFIFTGMLCFVLFTGFFKIYESGEIKADGSGTMRIVYSELIDKVENNNYRISTFPFGEENVREYFSSENVSIDKLQIVKPGDTAYMVILDLKFRNIGDLNEIKGFRDMRINLSKKDKGTEFKWIISATDDSKLINTIMTNLKFEGEIISGNSTPKDGMQTWFKNNFNKEDEFTVTVNSDLLKSAGGKFTAPVPPPTISGSGNDIKEEASKDQEVQTEKEEQTKKSCSVFGIELPLVLLAGLTYYRMRRTGSKSK